VEVKSLYSTFNECASDGKLDRPAFKKALGYAHPYLVAPGVYPRHPDTPWFPSCVLLWW
jgi:hypothetical protein